MDQVSRVAENEILSGTLTRINSSAEKIISSRHQEHFWIANDGSFHILINQGNQGLVLYSSFDEGTSWQDSLSIPNTGKSSTSDGLLVDDHLMVVYSSSQREIKLSQLNYNSEQKQWTLEGTRSVYTNELFTASHPTLTIDSDNRIWSAFTLKNRLTQESSIEISYTNDRGKNWQDSDLSLAAPSLDSRKSARIVSLSEGVGVVYSDGLTLNWASNTEQLSNGETWQHSLLFEYENPVQRDPNGTHFSVIVDQLDNIHIATNNGQKRLLYIKYNQQEKVWQEPRLLTDFRSASYMQISLSEDDRLLITYDARRNGQTYLEVIESSDYGESFSPGTTLLFHPERNTGNPRIETPSLTHENLPILQQVSDRNDEVQGLAYFNYELEFSDQFVTDDVIVSNPNRSLRDPEYDQLGYRLAWQDRHNNLWVAPINPQTGDFILEEATLVDTNLAPLSSPDRNRNSATWNGPEWVYTKDGSQILYTLVDDSGDWVLGRALWNGTEWEAGSLGVEGHIPNGTRVSDDESPLVRYFVGTEEQPRRAQVGWLELENPDTGGILPFQPGRWRGVRWVEGERSLTFSLPTRELGQQLFQYDIDTETITQLTFNDTRKGAAFMWQAPEFDGELIFFVVETRVNEQEDSFTQTLGIYRNIEGEWIQINSLKPPSQKQVIFSPEPFVYEGKSYVSMILTDSTSDIRDTEFSEVWIAGIDPEVDFYRQVSDPSFQTIRKDAEPFITENGVFIYYTDKQGGIIHRADTGLGLPNIAPTVGNPIPDQTTTIDNPFEFTFAADSFEDADGDSLTYSATLADGSPLPSWLSFDQETVTFRGTPVAENIGSLNVTVQADDSRGGIASDTFDIAVTDIPSVNPDDDNPLQITDVGLDLTSLPGEQVRVSLQVSGDADFANLGGLYRLANEEGGVIDPITGGLIMPGNTDYIQAALSNRILDFDEAGIASQTLLGGFIYAPYLLVDGETAYFPFIDANADGIDHLRLLGDNIFAFEDMFGGGDFSYDDFVVEVEIL